MNDIFRVENFGVLVLKFCRSKGLRVLVLEVLVFKTPTEYRRCNAHTTVGPGDEGHVVKEGTIECRNGRELGKRKILKEVFDIRERNIRLFSISVECGMNESNGDLLKFLVWYKEKSIKAANLSAVV